MTKLPEPTELNLQELTRKRQKLNIIHVILKFILDLEFDKKYTKVFTYQKRTNRSKLRPRFTHVDAKSGTREQMHVKTSMLVNVTD